ncbi:helix-turn-helix domain-containing protein [Paenibacillus mesotrionivorans]|uniref:Helix-turn-helix domain-containing protein n=1 Tax=Paenibacillus mesotrionivorans TaxID=3160968 RepID=A0ACC7NZ50_9BACL
MLKRISLKIQLIYISLFVLIIGLLAAMNYVSSIRQLESQVVESNRNVLSQITKRLDSMLQEVNLTVINYLRMPGVQSFFEAPSSGSPAYLLGISALQDQLGSVMGTNFNMQSTMLYSRAKDEVMTASDVYSLQERTEMAWIRSFMESKFPKWTGLGPKAGLNGGEAASASQILLVHYYPLNTGPSDSKGLAITRINEKSISAMFDDLQFSGSGNVFLMDGSGRILSHQDPGFIWQSIEGQSYSRELLARQGQGFLTDKGSRSLIFYDTSYTGWKLVYIVSQRQISTLTLTIRYILAGLACAMVLVAVAATLFINRRWFAPMERFVGKLEELAGRRGGGRRSGDSFHELEFEIRQVFTGYYDAERRLHESLPARKLQLMFELLTGARTRYQAAEPLLEQAGIRLYPAHYTVLAMEFDQSGGWTKPGDMNLFLYALCNVAEELASSSEGMKGAAVQMNGYQAVMVLSFADSSEARNLQAARGFAEALLGYIEACFKRTICVGIGGCYTGFDSIKTSYQEALQMISCKILTGQNTVITPDEVGNWDNGRLLEVFETADALVEAVRQAQAERTELLLEALFARSSQCGLSKEMVVQLCLQTVLRFLQLAEEAGLGDLFRTEHLSLPGKLEHSRSLADMQEAVGGMAAQLVAALQEKRSSRRKSAELIESVMAYVNGHYDQSDLSVNFLADRYGLTPNYISRLFKEYARCNFVDYLAGVRAKEAARLLLASPLKLDEVAFQVGYTNFSSFLRNFKKHYGMTPTEYRQLHRSGDSIG